MEEVIVLDNEDSNNSIVEVEVPKKVVPVIDIDADEIFLNIGKGIPKTVLAKEIINSNQMETFVPETGDNVCGSLQLINPDHWTLDMIKFYNEDWGNEEQFIVEKIQEKMDKSPLLWEVSRKDILFMHNKIKRSNIKCWNCCQRGHHVAFCPDPPHIPKCHMCGTPGHLENSCPNSKCLNCGNPSREYVTCCFKCRNQSNQKCSRCQLIGHNFINCSDHWRLFHLTTDSSSVKIPEKNIYKPLKDMWCSNCGRRGHIQAHCLCRRDCSGFTDTLPFVASYQKAFNSNTHSNKPNNHKHTNKNELFWKKLRVNKEGIMAINAMHKISKTMNSQLKKKLKRCKRRKREKNKKKRKAEQ